MDGRSVPVALSSSLCVAVTQEKYGWSVLYASNAATLARRQAPRANRESERKTTASACERWTLKNCRNVPAKPTTSSERTPLCRTISS